MTPIRIGRGRYLMKRRCLLSIIEGLLGFMVW